MWFYWVCGDGRERATDQAEYYDRNDVISVYHELRTIY
jgi:hypothetical protein